MGYFGYKEGDKRRPGGVDGGVLNAARPTSNFFKALQNDNATRELVCVSHRGLKILGVCNSGGELSLFKTVGR